MKKLYIKAFLFPCFFTGLIYLLISINQKSFDCFKWQIETFNYVILSVVILCFFIAPVLILFTKQE